MHFSLSLLALAAPVVLASPLERRDDCMSNDDATNLVNVYARLISNYTADDGSKYLTSDFVDVSDSIDTFIHLKLGGPTFPTKEAFMTAQLSNPPFPVEVESVDAVTCNAIALQWKAAFGDANLPSKGITILKTAMEDSMWKIKQISVEFNSLIWLLDMGGSYIWEGTTFSPDSPDPTLLGGGTNDSTSDSASGSGS